MWIHLLSLELIDGASSVAEPEPPIQDVIPAGSRRRPFMAPREKPQLAHGDVLVTGRVSVLVIGHKAVEYPPDQEVLQFLGMV